MSQMAKGSAIVVFLVNAKGKTKKVSSSIAKKDCTSSRWMQQKTMWQEEYSFEDYKELHDQSWSWTWVFHCNWASL